MNCVSGIEELLVCLVNYWWSANGGFFEDVGGNCCLVFAGGMQFSKDTFASGKLFTKALEYFVL